MNINAPYGIFREQGCQDYPLGCTHPYPMDIWPLTERGSDNFTWMTADNHQDAWMFQDYSQRPLFASVLQLMMACESEPYTNTTWTRHIHTLYIINIRLENVYIYCTL